MTKSKQRQQRMQRAHGTDWATCPPNQIHAKLIQETPHGRRKRVPRHEIDWQRWGFS